MSDEQPTCGFCKRSWEAQEVCGPLQVAPNINVAAHQKCMQYSALLTQYRISSFGGFKIPKVEDEMRRGRKTRCHICNKMRKSGKKGAKVISVSGATCGCAIDRCQRSFHFYCAKLSDTVITKRLEVTNKENKKVVLYRVFCSKEHQESYETKAESKIDYVSDSDADVESDADRHMQSVASSYECSVPVVPVSPFKLQASPMANKSRRSTSVSSSSDSAPAPALTSSRQTPKTVRGLSSSSGGSRMTSSADNSVKRTLGTVMPLPHHSSGSTVRSAGGNLLTPHESGNEQPARKRSRRMSSSPATAAGKSDTSMDETKLRHQANPEDCMICFFEQCSSGGDQGDNVAGIMQQMARELYGVPHSAVYIWQYSSDSHDTTLTPKHMLYFLKDISQALSQNNVTRLERLVFDLSDADISVYSNLVRSHQDLGADLETKIIEKMRKQINTYFIQAEAMLKEDVGCMLPADQLSGNVMFLRVCQVIDPGHVIRSRLGHQADLIIWDESTTLANFSSDGRSQYQSHEKETLLKWLGKNVNSPQILTFPSEPIFIHKAHHSTTYQLKRAYQKKPSMSQSNNVLVFLGPVDEEVINFDVYVRKMLRQLVEERLSAHSPVYCVCDVGGATGILSNSDLIPPQLPPYAELTVWSAQNPNKLPVSAVLVKIMFKSGDLWYDEDGSE